MDQRSRRRGFCGSVTLHSTFSLVRVPFPFTDRAVQKRRPALVVSAPDFQVQSGHLVLAMVTTANQSSWPLDWPIQELAGTGLPKPCLVRLKLFSLDERLILGHLGALADQDRSGVAAHLRRLLPCD
ncbi:MAG: type II toxin-antitoxin system PemK/MazF family toxin [Synechococcaceae bacterium WB9_4xB_025]|nr:type II toxin-antitoxin system PemK/MazF family toxin [Synechococcaceae bacterium WB9_4xB_025]